MSFFRKLERRSTSMNFLDPQGRDVVWNGMPSAASSGVRVTPDKALQLVTVWACVRLIASSIASLPTSAFVRNGLVRESYPNPKWMFNPNPEQIAMVFWEQVLTSLLLHGNAYIYVVRDAQFNVLELWAFHPEHVQPRRDGPNRALVYHCTDMFGNTFDLQPYTEMLHIPAFSTPGSLVGLNPIAYAKQAIGLALGTEEFGGKFFAQGSTAQVVLESQGPLTEEEMKRTVESWKKAHTGLKNSHNPAILGGLSAKNLSIPNDSAQFLETRGFQREEIATFFGVAPHMIGLLEKSTSWGTGIEQQMIGFVTFTLRPWLERIEQSCNILFPPESRAFMKFSVEGLLRGDIKARYDAYSIGLNNGFLSPDEVRALEDRPPIPDGKGGTFVRPLNLGAVGEPAPTQQGTTA